MKDDVNCSLDGRFVVLSKFQEVIRGSLLVNENLFVFLFFLTLIKLTNHQSDWAFLTPYPLCSYLMYLLMTVKKNSSKPITHRAFCCTLNFVHFYFVNHLFLSSPQSVGKYVQTSEKKAETPNRPADNTSRAPSQKTV